jgi:hypothetical protein
MTRSASYTSLTDVTVTKMMVGGAADGGSRALEAALAMLNAASAATRREVHTLLSAVFHAPPTAAQLRVAELGFLGSLVAGPVEDGFEFRECDRTHYDNVRPKSAPSSRRLVDTYGSWSRVCRAAYSLQRVGTSAGPGKPWPTMNRNEPMGAHYTREEALAAVRLCAKELRAAGLAGVPTSRQYDEWVRRRKLQAKKRGQKLRLPYAQNIYRRFPRPRSALSVWQLILVAAGVGGD